MDSFLSDHLHKFPWEFETVESRHGTSWQKDLSELICLLPNESFT